LTAEVELALGDAGLVKFLDENRQAFKELASRSYGFAHDNVVATGLPLRRDDVAKSLAIALRTNETLRECLQPRSYVKTSGTTDSQI